MIKIKRAYEPAEQVDGRRFLVDRLWPRGIKKEELQIESWNKEVSPSDWLRKRFHHDPAKWPEFQRRYFEELNKKPETWQPLAEAARGGTITLVFGAREIEHNNAVALKTFLEKHLKPKARQRKRELVHA